ncbi:MAG: D-2-hydroxyacid dehydrogenase [Tenericutes bacterium]|nr:D-2-hydroxyacid dehydrogenase [Mycoplasmatota bacterium]
MTIYVDPKLIGRKNFQKLVLQFPTVNFVTEVTRPTEIEALITMPKIVKEMDLDDYPKLKWIQYLMAGFDGLDLAKFREKNIDFCNAQNIFSKSIAEDVFTKIFYFNRNVKHYIDSKTEKKWEPIRGELELTNSTVLILGVGSIGKELAKRFKAFEAYVIGYRSRDLPEENFDEIIVTEENLNMAIQRADYVILALPLTEETTYMFDKEKLDMMRSSALLINVARGKVLKQTDLINTLKYKKIRGAGLDVFDPEPLPVTSPLWELDNVYITPHNASSSPYMRNRLYEMIIMNLSLYLEGQPVKYILN